MRLLPGLLVLLMLLPAAQASLVSEMSAIEGRIDEYNSGAISAPQLIVYMEYLTKRLNNADERAEKAGFTESEIAAVFDEIDEEESFYRGSRYGKVHKTADFYVVFEARPVRQHERDYYERREAEAEALFAIGYYLQPTQSSKDTAQLQHELSGLIGRLSAIVDADDIDAIEPLAQEWSEFRQRASQPDECAELFSAFEQVGETRKETQFRTQIVQELGQECWEDTQCEDVCEPAERCSDSCDVRDVCENVCHEEEVCEEVCSGEGDDQTCSQECSPHEVCEEQCSSEPYCETQCETYDQCHTECEPVESCNDITTGEVSVEATCDRKGYANIWVNAWGEQLDIFQDVNGYDHEWNCDAQIEGLVRIRQAFQDDINDEFARWFFQDFLGDDVERIDYGEYGLRAALGVLARNEEEISQNIQCSSTKGWPAGFEPIEVTYDDGTARLEVWEKLIPVEHGDVKYYTTLYTYSWIPEKETAKRFVQYKLQAENLGPTAQEVEEIKSDEGRMELVNTLSEKYGGSLDIRIELKDQDTTVVQRFLQINPEVAVAVVESSEEKADISVEVEFDALYNFLTYMTREIDGDSINGPYWVEVDDGGPGKAFGALGALSKMWREGVTVKPRHAFIKMLFSTQDIASLLADSGSESYEKESITGNVVAVGDFEK